MKNLKNVFSNRFSFKLLVLICFGFFITNSCQKEAVTNQDNLGTFDNPEAAFAFTKRTLDFISKECNNGIENATYKVNEYEQTKTKIFKNTSHE